MSEVIGGIFLMFFGLFFGGIPSGVLVFTLNQFRDDGFNSIIIVPFLAVFILVGLAIFITGLKLIVNHFKRRRVRNHGTLTTATFVNMEGSHSSSRYGLKNYRIVLKYNDINGIENTYKTRYTYKYEDANYFAQIKTFKIRYIGKTVEIVETIDYEKYDQINPNSNNEGIFGSILNNKGIFGSIVNTINAKLNPNANKPKEYYYRCDYCGNIQDKAEKCKSCGARIHPDSRRIKHWFFYK